MNWKELKDILDEEFPPMSMHEDGDFIGEQVAIKEEINKVMVTLDVTLDVISQAQMNGVDLIISHHPLIFGEREEVLNNDLFIKSKVSLMEKTGIGLYVIHTNADFNPNSIAYMQALAIDAEDVEQGNNNKYVTATLKEEVSTEEFMNTLKDSLELKDIEFRSNFDLDVLVSRIRIASGAAGSEIDFNDEVINIIGEVKHHEWVAAMEKGAKVIEISHFSEKIFKDIVEVFLNDHEVEVIKSEESNGYKIY